MYTVDFPDQLQQKLDERAFATGCDVVDLIQVAVIEFIGRDLSPVAGRIPDPPLLSSETTAPYDLPRGEATFVTPEIVIDGSARIPDLVGLDVSAAIGFLAGISCRPDKTSSNPLWISAISTRCLVHCC